MSKKNHPYQDYSETAFWRKSVSGIDIAHVDPVIETSLRITKLDKIVTAGSCFAQHIARFLKAHDFNYLLTEPGFARMDKALNERFNYGIYSARFGNIYTARQLKQLWLRATGDFVPIENSWHESKHHWVDPFRPTIQPDGFYSEKELIADREAHFNAVMQAFSTMDIFIFTLGLTEAWIHQQDGAVFPLCPGVIAGEFNQDKHQFYNFSVDEVVNDFEYFYQALKKINPKVNVILTVSPVPLMATATKQHVLNANTYSKSVLRVAAEQLCQSLDDIYYFPSFEIISTHYHRGQYFAKDCRSVTEEGVAKVMRLFFKHYTDLADDKFKSTQSKPTTEPATEDKAKLIVDALCDEEYISR